jgi:outer membrane lipoprotein-sorting protein
MRKKLFLLPLLAAVLLLGGCAGKKFEPDRISELYSAARQVNARIKITTNTGVLQTYVIDYARNGVESVSEILEPESLRGIRAVITDGSPRLVFDDAAAETFLPSVSGFTPMDAMDGLLRDMAGAAPADYAIEKSGGEDIAALTYPQHFTEYAAEKRVWLSADDLMPHACEFYLDGMMTMRLEVESIQMYK